MCKRLAALLMARRLLLKGEWDRRLHAAEPPHTALALPDILVHRMDDTLDQLDALLRRRAMKRWPEGSPPPLSQLSELCRCGLNPLLVYFTTGGASLTVAAPELTPEEKNYLDQVWYYLSQQEIGALCAVCCPRN